MSDDTCGWPTFEGHGCTHPPTEDNGRCWLHADDDRDIGRPFSISEDDHDDILRAAREGLSERGCARAAGTGWDQLNRYLDANPDFRGSFTRAREQGERRLVADGLRDPDTDSSMAKFLLATSFDYVKTERREVTGEGGGPVEISLNETVVETPYSEK